MTDAPRAILHVDMDAFYASVEVLDHPEWRGKPVIVGADPRGGRGRGVVSTASYEARKFGVRSALPIGIAFQRCPQGIFVPPRFDRYAELSRRIMEICGGLSPLVEPLSLDEAFLDLTGTERLHGAPAEQAAGLKRAIARETGLTASVGLASCKLVAKIASDLEKPDGLVVVPAGGEAAFLAPLPLSRLWGVGPATERRLAGLSMSTIGDLARLDDAAARRLLGDGGPRLAALARGEDDRPVSGESRRKSVGREHTYDVDVTDRTAELATLLELSDDVARRLRAESLRGRTVTLKIRYQGFETHTRSSTRRAPVCTTEEIYPVARELFLKEDPRRPVRLLGVSLSNLVEEPQVQGRLFDRSERQALRVGRSADRIAEKFGAGALVRGSTLRRRG